GLVAASPIRTIPGGSGSRAALGHSSHLPSRDATGWPRGQSEEPGSSSPTTHPTGFSYLSTLPNDGFERRGHRKAGFDVRARGRGSDAMLLRLSAQRLAPPRGSVNRFCRGLLLSRPPLPVEKTARRPLAELDDRAHRHEAHRAHVGAAALPVTARERVVREEHAPARLPAAVAFVELERERAVQRGGPREARVVGDHRARGQAHPAADALDVHQRVEHGRVGAGIDAIVLDAFRRVGRPAEHPEGPRHRRYTTATRMSGRHDRLRLLDRYLRIPTISRQVTPEMVDAVRA